MIINLQVLRAVAAYMVLLHHFSGQAAFKLGIAGPIGFGAAGVDIFFVISGFIMVATTMGRTIGPAEFLRRRVARLVPVYWLVTAVVVLLVLVGFHPIGVFSVSAGDMIQSLLFVPFLRGNLIEPILSVGWTLNYEAFFYAIFACFLLVRAEGLRLTLLVAVLVGLGLAGLLEPEGFYARFYTRPIVIDFALGAVLGYIHHRTSGYAAGTGARRIGYGSLGAGIALLIIGEVAWRTGSYDSDLLPFARLAVWGGASLLIVAGALAVERSGQAWSQPLLIAQGDASYSIYLIHNLVLHAAFKVAAVVALVGWQGATFVLVIAVGMTAVLGQWLYRRFELPLNHALRAPSGRAPVGNLAVRP